MADHNNTVYNSCRISPSLNQHRERYQHLMELLKSGKLLDRVKKCPDQNFWRNGQVLCKHAGISDVAFHDLRATCITEWFEQGLMPHEVQRLAGHSSIETTMRYYVGYRDTLIDRARQASTAALKSQTVAKLLEMPQNTPFWYSLVVADRIRENIRLAHKASVNDGMPNSFYKSDPVSG